MRRACNVHALRAYSLLLFVVRGACSRTRSHTDMRLGNRDGACKLVLEPPRTVASTTPIGRPLTTVCTIFLFVTKQLHSIPRATSDLHASAKAWPSTRCTLDPRAPHHTDRPSPNLFPTHQGNLLSFPLKHQTFHILRLPMPAVAATSAPPGVFRNLVRNETPPAPTAGNHHTH